RKAAQAGKSNAGGAPSQRGRSDATKSAKTGKSTEHARDRFKTNLEAKITSPSVEKRPASKPDAGPGPAVKPSRTPRAGSSSQQPSNRLAQWSPAKGFSYMPHCSINTGSCQNAK